MLELYKPDMYKKSIYDINFDKLKECGIKCLLFDLDNTLVTVKKTKPTRKIKDFIEKLKSEGFKVIIVSNSNKNRLTPFKNALEVDCAASSRKPFSTKYNKIMKEYGYEMSEIAMIGDQIITDIYGGNRVGIFTVLVNPISYIDEAKITKFNRFFERKIIRKLESKKLFRKGVYYD